MKLFRKNSKVLLILIILFLLQPSNFAFTFTNNNEIIINFTKLGTKMSAPNYVDSGKLFAKQTNGLEYGWNISHDDNIKTYKDFGGFLKTYVAMKKGSVWELSLPNGEYDLNIEMSDSSLSKVQSINVENVVFVDSFLANKNTQYYFQNTVQVNDGRLTINNGDSGEGSTHIDRIFITPLKIDNGNYLDFSKVTDSRGRTSIDVDESHPDYAAIKYNLDRTFLQLNDLDMFNPQNKVNKYEFRVALARVNYLTTQLKYLYTDEFLINSKVMNKEELSTGNLTNLDVAKYLSSAQLKIHGVSLNSSPIQISDISKLTDSEKKAIQNMVDHKIMTLYTGNLFKPSHELTRAELANILMNYHRSIVLKYGVPKLRLASSINNAGYSDGESVKVVDLPDPNLQRIITIALNKSSWNEVTYGDLKTIKELYAQSNNISSLKGLQLLTSLELLSLDWNKISSIPSDISRLTNLKVLTFGYNNIYEVPDALTEIKTLEFLILTHNNLSSLPQNIGNLENLKALFADDNYIEALPLSISKLTKLETLNLNENNISIIPDGSLIQPTLKNLVLSNNSIKQIPKGISQASALENLNMSVNKLTVLSDELGNLSHLKSLEINQNRIKTIPNSLNGLVALETLSLSQNDIQNIANLSGLTSLVELDLSRNKLSTLNLSWQKLNRLKWLSLSNNLLTDVPIGIEKALGLVDLSLSNNKIKSITPALYKLINLKALSLKHNGITELTSDIKSLENLKGLYMSDNQLTGMPAEVSQLKNLSSLYLDNNRLTSIPDPLLKMDSLMTLSIIDNPIISNISIAKLANKDGWISEIRRQPYSQIKDILGFKYVRDNTYMDRVTKIWQGPWSLVWVKDGYTYNENMGHLAEQIVSESQLILKNHYFSNLKYPNQISVHFDSSPSEAGAYGLGGINEISISNDLLKYDEILNERPNITSFSTLAHEVGHTMMAKFQYNQLSNKWRTPSWYNEVLACSVQNDWERLNGYVLTGTEYQYNMLALHGFPIYGAKGYDDVLLDFEHQLKTANNYNYYRLFGEYLKVKYGQDIFAVIHNNIEQLSKNNPITYGTELSEMYNRQLDEALKKSTAPTVFTDYVKWHKVTFTVNLSVGN